VSSGRASALNVRSSETVSAPALSEAEIQTLEEELTPYYLPSDLVTLYQWHDGWTTGIYPDYVALLHECDFTSLEEAVAQYHSLRELPLEDAWHPLWFPAFGENGYFIELQSDPDRPAGQLWSYHSHDFCVSPGSDSVASLFRTSLELWRVGWLGKRPPGRDVSR
jgi:cell wall assembly regulator SMI1